LNNSKLVVKNQSKNEYDLPAIGNLGHEGVLESGGESSTTTSSESRLLDLIDDPVLAHGENLLGLVPVTALESTLDKGVLIFIQVRENTVLIAQVSIGSHWCRQ